MCGMPEQKEEMQFFLCADARAEILNVLFSPIDRDALLDRKVPKDQD
jgi:hypothetical protein